MRIRIRKEERKSVAYDLAPEELTIVLPNGKTSQEEFDSLANVISNANIESDPVRLITKGEIHEIVKKWVEKVQAEPKRVQIRNMKSKWASCSPEGNLVFNSSLTEMPREFAEYVVCHELLHLKVRRHNRLFRSLLSAYMPDWEERIMMTMEFILHDGVTAVYSY